MITTFTSLDFETSYGHIPCSIGIVEFADGKIVSEYYSLIKPINLQFSPINSSINGIRLADVENEREFHEIWDEIQHYFHNKNIVAHNASTDISILEKTLEYYNLPSPIYTAFCTLQISRLSLSLENYKLSTVANHLNIEQKNYHNALDDAFVCGHLFNRLAESAFEFQLKKRRVTAKIISAETIKITEKTSEVLSNTVQGKTFLFTGKLSLFTRQSAEEMVEKHGGRNISAVSYNLNYLVVGEKAGTKLKKAQDIGTIKVLDEQEFLELLKS